MALSRAVEVSGSAAGGVACASFLAFAPEKFLNFEDAVHPKAMAVASMLTGFSGIVVAAAAGCSGFAGSLGGREVAPEP